MVPRYSMKAREVRIPGALVDAVVVDETQQQGYEVVYDAALSGQKRREGFAQLSRCFHHVWS